MDRRIFVLLSCFYFSTPTTAEARLIDGIFTEPTLDPGYHLVATIPAGASNLNVSELRHTDNCLAVRLQDGRFLLNGNYGVSWSGVLKAAGASFIYHRQTAQQLESFTAVGPLLEPIDVMLLYQEPNSGVVYRYVAPGSAKDRASRAQAKSHLRMMGEEAPGPPPPKRHRKRKFSWRTLGSGPCSKTCGGGVQARSHVCVREHNQAQVPAKRCHGSDEPPEVQTRCNVGPCPPKITVRPYRARLCCPCTSSGNRWRTGTWTKCSVTCGAGFRTRDHECVQEVNNLLTVRVADGACLDSKLPASNESCAMPVCSNETNFSDTQKNSNFAPRWDVGEWSQCSTSCGSGKRTRSVICVTGDRSCSFAEMPGNEESCNLADCSALRRSDAIVEARTSRWFHTEWSRQCSAECGTGFQTRKVICVSDESSGHVDGIAIKKNERNDDENCEKDTRPESTRTCSSNKTCSGQWFTGPWTQCSASCDTGEQTREAVCVTTLRGSLRMVLDMNCPAVKPETRKSCRGPPCQSIWYTSDWTECTRSCGIGVQSREVKCLSDRSVEEFAHRCNETARPGSRVICNDYPCRSTVELRDGEGSTRSRYIQNDPEVTNVISGDENCKDNMPNCVLVTQARLCIYPFYRKICCASCSRSRWEEME